MVLISPSLISYFHLAVFLPGCYNCNVVTKLQSMPIFTEDHDFATPDCPSFPSTQCIQTMVSLFQIVSLVQQSSDPVNLEYLSRCTGYSYRTTFNHVRYIYEIGFPIRRLKGGYYTFSRAFDFWKVFQAYFESLR